MNAIRKGQKPKKEFILRKYNIPSIQHHNTVSIENSMYHSQVQNKAFDNQKICFPEHFD